MREHSWLAGYGLKTELAYVYWAVAFGHISAVQQLLSLADVATIMIYANMLPMSGGEARSALCKGSSANPPLGKATPPAPC